MNYMDWIETDNHEPDRGAPPAVLVPFEQLRPGERYQIVIDDC